MNTHPQPRRNHEANRSNAPTRQFGRPFVTIREKIKPTKVNGIISTTAKGMGFVRTSDNPDIPDIILEQGALGCALHGDKVEVEVFGIAEDGRKVGRVTAILERSRNLYVGVVSKEADQLIVIGDDRHLYVPIALHTADVRDNSSSIVPGVKVQVEIQEWNDSKRLPLGRIRRIIGKKGENETEIQAIVLERGFVAEFPKSVVDEAEKVAKEYHSREEHNIGNRRDFRSRETGLVCTIDPYDAKDFDDALSFKDLGDGTYEIGVHIADVSHFVHEGGSLDKEAVKRGCSVYLVDRTIPMLPEVLSNDICSLNPDVDRFTFSAVFILDKNGHIKSRWFGKSVIHSHKRFTYELAQVVIDGGPAPKELANVPIELDQDTTDTWTVPLRTMNDIAKKLQAEKFKRGAIEFDQDEIKFKLDANGKPIGVYRKPRLETHKLVEEFMLLANREVAKYIFDSLKKHGATQGEIQRQSIYRIHDLPEKERLTELGILVRALGHDFPEDFDNMHDRSLNERINVLLDKIKGTPEESLIKTATIRSMAKAIYSTKNIGHFGLAFEFYTHFTSPIRRYPDLIVHRTLERELEINKQGQNTGNENTKSAVGEFAKMESIAIHTSEQEVKAADAERASRKFKQVEYMSERVGQTFDGIISGVTEWGLYIEEKETRCEGMARIKDLGDDFFRFDRPNFALVGDRTKKRYRLGDPIKFTVMNADLDRKTLDYKVVS